MCCMGVHEPGQDITKQGSCYGLLINLHTCLASMRLAAALIGMDGVATSTLAVIASRTWQCVCRNRSSRMNGGSYELFWTLTQAGGGRETAACTPARHGVKQHPRSTQCQHASSCLDLSLTVLASILCTCSSICATGAAMSLLGSCMVYWATQCSNQPADVHRV